MLQPFRYLVCAAVVGFASHAGAVSVAPACDHCGACNRSHANTQYAPPTRVRIRWVSVYEDGRMRLVPKAYRVRVSDPATQSNPTQYNSTQSNTTQSNTTQYNPTQYNPTQYDPTQSNPASTTPPSGAPTSKDLASSAQAPPGQVTPAPVPRGQVPPAPAPAIASPSKLAQASATSSSPASSDRQGLANRAQALLQAKCARCHGEQGRAAGLDLRSRDTILKGGASGPAIIPGQPDESLALQRVRAGEMPPRGRLSSDEIATLQQWIAAGAPSDRAQ
jgi:mono/diheme cytochrome c family protein